MTDVPRLLQPENVEPQRPNGPAFGVLERPAEAFKQRFTVGIVGFGV